MERRLDVFEYIFYCQALGVDVHAGLDYLKQPDYAQLQLLLPAGFLISLPPRIFPFFALILPVSAWRLLCWHTWAIPVK